MSTNVNQHALNKQRTAELRELFKAFALTVTTLQAGGINPAASRMPSPVKGAKRPLIF